MSRLTTSTVPVPRRRSGPFASRLVGVLLALWLPVVLIAVWWFVSAGSTSPFFPPLSRIVQETWNQWVVYGAWTNLIASVRNLILGYLAGVIIGLVGGTVLWRWRRVRQAAKPLIYFLYVLPAPALLPAMIAIFGIGEMRQIALIALGSIWPTLLNTLDGMRGISGTAFDTARVLRLGGIRTFFRVVLPAAAPQIAAGMRASLTIAIVLMVVSEMVAARSGIGYFILQAQAEFAIVKMWTGILVLALLGTVLNYLFVVVERRALRWYYRSRAANGS